LYPSIDGEISLPDRSVQLCIRQHPEKGRGIYTNVDLPAYTLIETSPILLLDQLIPPLDHYTFCWPGPRPHALALGIGSLFNHHHDPNTFYKRDIQQGCIRFYTLRPVKAGEELCISYGSVLWFKNADQVDTMEEETEQDIFNGLDIFDDE
jgi:hypothetical protein